MLVSLAPVGQDPAETLVCASVPAAPRVVVPETHAGRVRGDGCAQTLLRGHLSRKKGVGWCGAQWAGYAGSWYAGSVTASRESPLIVRAAADSTCPHQPKGYDIPRHTSYLSVKLCIPFSPKEQEFWGVGRCSELGPLDSGCGADIAVLSSRERVLRAEW